MELRAFESDNPDSPLLVNHAAWLYRSRNENGHLRDTRDDKHIGTLEKQYNRDFGVREDMHVGTLLKETRKESVNDLIQSNIGKK